MKISEMLGEGEGQWVGRRAAGSVGMHSGGLGAGSRRAAGNGAGRGGGPLGHKGGWGQGTRPRGVGYKGDYRGWGQDRGKVVESLQGGGANQRPASRLSLTQHTQSQLARRAGRIIWLCGECQCRLSVFVTQRALIHTAEPGRLFLFIIYFFILFWGCLYLPSAVGVVWCEWRVM